MDIRALPIKKYGRIVVEYKYNCYRIDENVNDVDRVQRVLDARGGQTGVHIQGPVLFLVFSAPNCNLLCISILYS